jgi:predicted dinucleotide-binding enzyme
MRIAIIGAGSVGATLGRAWIKLGEDVIWGVRNPADPKHATLPPQTEAAFYRLKRAKYLVCNIYDATLKIVAVANICAVAVFHDHG